jgi:hypothetical protein
MNLSAPKLQLLRLLSSTWPASWKLPLDLEEPSYPADHPLAGELAAIDTDAPIAFASFVHVAGDTAHWLTIASDADKLHAVIQDLRAWLIPSFAWEDPRRAIAVPGQTAGPLADVLATLSPAGYFRWRSRAVELPRIAEKLRGLRQTIAARPPREQSASMSLVELRQLFATALAAGNRGTAAAAIAAIDRLHLDSVSNTAFMQILLHDRFGETDQIIQDPRTVQLATLRMPLRVKAAVMRAYHTAYLKEPELRGDPASAALMYATRVAPDIAGLVRSSDPGSGIEIRRMLAYHAVMTGDAGLATEVIHSAGASDPWLAGLFAPLLTVPERPIEERFFEARARLDWRVVQELGEQWLAQSDEPAAVLRKSLQFLPNPHLQAILDANTTQPVVETPAAAVVVEQKQQTIVQDWRQWLAAVQNGEWEAASFYLENVAHPDAGACSTSAIMDLTAQLEEIYTGPPLTRGSRAEGILLLGLPQLIDEFTRAENFPNSSWADFYLALLLMWTHAKAGSVVATDGELLLALAQAVLQVRVGDEKQVIEQIQRWWAARPVRKMLPLGLQATDLLLDYVADRTAAETMWYAITAVVSQDRASVTPGERALLRYLGIRLAISAQVLDEVAPVEVTTAEEDPIRAAKLRRIEILHSWVPQQAGAAEQLIQARTDAEVHVIEAEDTGPWTRRAAAADVILYLWKRSSHAVFYGIDSDMRKRLVYVPGTTAASIVMALEAWVRSRGRADA